MRENIKLDSLDYENGNFTTAWYLEWIPKHVEEDVEIPGKFAEIPVPFKFEVFNEKRATKKQRQIIAGYMSTDNMQVITTREDHPFKREDYILWSLDKYPQDKLNKRGIPFSDFSRIKDLDDMVDKAQAMNDLRFYNNTNKKIHVLFTS